VKTPRRTRFKGCWFLAWVLKQNASSVPMDTTAASRVRAGVAVMNALTPGWKTMDAPIMVVSVS